MKVQFSATDIDRPVGVLRGIVDEPFSPISNNGKFANLDQMGTLSSPSSATKHVPFTHTGTSSSSKLMLASKFRPVTSFDSKSGRMPVTKSHTGLSRLMSGDALDVANNAFFREMVEEDNLERKSGQSEEVPEEMKSMLNVFFGAPGEDDSPRNNIMFSSANIHKDDKNKFQASKSEEKSLSTDDYSLSSTNSPKSPSSPVQNLTIPPISYVADLKYRNSLSDANNPNRPSSPVQNLTIPAISDGADSNQPDDEGSESDGPLSIDSIKGRQLRRSIISGSGTPIHVPSHVFTYTDSFFNEMRVAANTNTSETIEEADEKSDDEQPSLLKTDSFDTMEMARRRTTQTGGFHIPLQTQNTDNSFGMITDDAAFPSASRHQTNMQSVDDYLRSLNPNALGSSAEAKTFTGHELRKLEIRLNSTFVQKEFQLGQNHSDTMNAAFNIAQYLTAVGRLPEALTLHKEIYVLRFTVLAPINPDLYISAHAVAEVLMELNQFQEAAEYARTAIDGRTEIFGEYDLKTMDSVSVLVRALYLNKQYRSAENLAVRVYEAYRSHIEQDGHNDINLRLKAAHELSVLGTLHKKINEDEKAEIEFREVLSERTELLGHKCEETIRAERDLAMILLKRKEKKQEMEFLITDATMGMRKLKGDLNPSTLAIFFDYGVIKEATGKYEDAEFFLRLSASGRKQLLGPSHPDTLRSSQLLSSVLHKQGKTKDSEQIMRNLYDSYHAKFGGKHIKSLNTRRELADILYRNAKYEKAVPLLEECWIELDQQKGSTHRDTLDTQYMLADSLMYLDDLEQATRAMNHFTDVLAQRTNILGPKHFVVIETMKRIEKAKQQLKIINDSRKLARGGKLDIVPEIYELDPVLSIPEAKSENQVDAAPAIEPQKEPSEVVVTDAPRTEISIYQSNIELNIPKNENNDDDEPESSSGCCFGKKKRKIKK